MNYVSEINRRSFLVGSAAAGSGLALGFHLPLSSDAAEAASGPEVNAWVVVQPDETVIIRIARSEMGQGTLTGLAQLAAEELECDWSKVTYEFPTPGQNVARKRVWGDFFTAGSRGIREVERLRPQGRRGGAHDANRSCGQRMESPCAGMLCREWGDHAQRFQSQHDLRQGCASSQQGRAAEGNHAQGSEGLENHRQGREAARHRRQSRRQGDLRHRHPTARHALRRHQGLPGEWRKSKKLRCRQDHRQQGCQKSREGRRLCRRGDCRQLVARQDRAGQSTD